MAYFGLRNCKKFGVKIFPFFQLCLASRFGNSALRPGWPGRGWSPGHVASCGTHLSWTRPVAKMPLEWSGMRLGWC